MRESQTDKIFLSILLCAMVFATGGFAQEDKNITVTDAVVAPIPDFLKATAVYMTITNQGAHDKVLDSVTSSLADSTEFHHMRSYQGLMRMTILKRLVIPAHGRAVLNENEEGDHLMLINLNKVLHRGDQVPLTLHFHDGSTRTVYAQVKGKEKESFPVIPGMRM